MLMRKKRVADHAGLPGLQRRQLFGGKLSGKFVFHPVVIQSENLNLDSVLRADRPSDGGERGPNQYAGLGADPVYRPEILSLAIFRRGIAVASRQAAMDNTTACAIGISGGKTNDSSSV